MLKVAVRKNCVFLKPLQDSSSTYNAIFIAYFGAKSKKYSVYSWQNEHLDINAKYFLFSMLSEINAPLEEPRLVGMARRGESTTHTPKFHVSWTN